MRMNKALIAIAGLLAGLVTLGAHADVTAVSASPSGARVPIAQPTSVSVAWTVTSNAAGSTAVRAARAEFRTPSAQVLATVNQPLSKSINGPTTVSLSETLRVPADVTKRALDLGFQQILYVRRFDDGGAMAEGQMLLHIAGAPSSTLGVARLVLSFDDRKPTRIVKRQALIKPRAELTLSGPGRVQAVWEVAGPDADGEAPVYRELEHVARMLASGEAWTLNGPTLPTTQAGAYRVRLRIVEPAPGFEPPEIHYVVTADAVNK